MKYPNNFDECSRIEVLSNLVDNIFQTEHSISHIKEPFKINDVVNMDLDDNDEDIFMVFTF